MPLSKKFKKLLLEYADISINNNEWREKVKNNWSKLSALEQELMYATGIWWQNMKVKRLYNLSDNFWDVVGTTDPDVLWALYNHTEQYKESPNKEHIINMAFETIDSNPWLISEEYLSDMFIYSKNIDELYERLLSKKISFYDKSILYAYLHERLNRGLDIDQWLDKIPPTHKLWDKIKITREFLDSLSAIKFFKFIKASNRKMPLTYEEIKERLFPIITNSRYAGHIEEILDKYGTDNTMFTGAAEILINKPDHNFQLNRLNNVDMSIILKFLNDKETIVEFLKFIYNNAPNNARSYIKDSLKAVK